MTEASQPDPGPKLCFSERIERRKEPFVLNGAPRVLTVTSNVLSTFCFSGLEGGSLEIQLSGLGQGPSVPHGLGSYRFRPHCPDLLETPWGEVVDLAGSASRCLAFRPHFQAEGNTLCIEPTPHNEVEDAFVVEVWLNLVPVAGSSRREGPFYLWADVVVCNWRACEEERLLRIGEAAAASLLGNSCFAPCRELIRWAIRRALAARVEE